MFWLLFKSTPYFPLYTKSLLTPYSVELINAHKSLLMYIVYTHTYTHTHTWTHPHPHTHTCTQEAGHCARYTQVSNLLNCMSHTHTHPHTHMHTYHTHTHTYTHHTGDWKLNQIHPRKQFVVACHTRTPTYKMYLYPHTHAHTIVHAVFRSSWPGICGRL